MPSRRSLVRDHEHPVYGDRSRVGRHRSSTGGSRTLKITEV